MHTFTTKPKEKLFCFRRLFCILQWLTSYRWIVRERKEAGIWWWQIAITYSQLWMTKSKMNRLSQIYRDAFMWPMWLYEISTFFSPCSSNGYSITNNHFLVNHCLIWHILFQTTKMNLAYHYYLTTTIIHQ